MNQRPSLDNRPLEVALVLTADEFVVPSWAGISELIAEFPVDSAVGSFVITKLPDEVEDYIIAVRGTNPDGVTLTRFKLYATGFEVLNFPVYDGELIPGDEATIEIWSASNTPAATVDVAASQFKIGTLTWNDNTLPTQVTYTLTGTAP
jgi:hypothetical protein